MRPRNTWALPALMVGALIVAPTSATAVPPQAGPAAAEPTSSAASTHVATLPTGDTVTMTTLPGGQRTFTVASAPRPAGEVVSFRGTTQGDRFYVVPSDAEPYLASGAVDSALFDIATLAQEERAGVVPIIVTYSGSAAARGAAAGNAAVSGALARGAGRQLPSINGVALRLTPTDIAGFWESIDVDGPAAQRSTLSFERSVRKVWLDRTVSASIDRSVGQVGAPVAHAAGLDGTGVKVAVLDTGYDPAHPDLAGKVVGSANFTQDASVTDRNGHGTHVASTVAGTGSASGGKYRGIAPGAELLVGKVLNDGGNGSSSTVIAGLEWAAAQGARVANLSLSNNNPSGHDDPMAMAVDSISESTGMLIVAAAGNKYNLRTVYSPGSARSALTVGAVNRSDQMAIFSSRGPGLTEAEVKPEITAPGVGIIAARAAGSNLGPIVDERYMMIDGTSMATPHVAGAVAILAQQHPDWRGADLKRALTSTTTPTPARWFEQGTGRLDVARAVTQGVFVSEPVNFGRFAYPQAGLPMASRPITFTNTTGTAVTLNLGLDVRGWNNEPAPVTLDASTVEVPANGTATVNLLVNPAAGPTGVYGGHITASSADGAIAVRSAVSWRKEGETAPLTVRVINSRGLAPAFASVRMIKIDGPDLNDPFVEQNPSVTAVNGMASTRVAAGTYHVYSNLNENLLDVRRITLAAAPEVAVPGQAEVVLDARTAVPLRPTVPERTDQVVAAYGFTRGTPTGGMPGEMTVLFPGSIEMYATPSGPLGTGFYSVYDQWTLQPPLLSAKANGQTLHPEYDVIQAAPKLVGDRKLDVARPGADVRGKAVLVGLPASTGDNPVGDAHELARQATEAAAQAGAAAVLIYVDSPKALPLLNLAGNPILQLALTGAEGAQLRREVNRKRVSLSLSGTLNPDHLYQLRFEHPDGVPAGYRKTVDPKKLMRINARYHSDKPNLGYTSTWFALSARHPSAFMIGRPFYAPAAFTELIGEPGEHFFWNRNTAQAASPFVFAPQQLRTLDQFKAGTPPRDETWFGSPIRIGVPNQQDGMVEQVFCNGCRDRNLLIPPQNEIDGSGRHFFWTFDSGAGSVVSLTRDGQTIPVDTSRGYPRFTLPETAGRYQMDLDQIRQRGVPDLRTLSTRTRTSWTFQSAPPLPGQMPSQYLCRVNRTGPCAFEPLIQLRYDLHLDLLNRARAGGVSVFRIDAGSPAAAPGRAPIAGMKVATSTDDGVTWRNSFVVPLGNGQFLALVLHPRGATAGSLRVESWDTAGNRVTQTTNRAYALA